MWWFYTITRSYWHWFSAEMRNRETAVLSVKEFSHSVTASYTEVLFSYFSRYQVKSARLNKNLEGFFSQFKAVYQDIFIPVERSSFCWSTELSILHSISDFLLSSSLKYWHKGCFSCEVCKMALSMTTYKGFEKKPYCSMWVFAPHWSTWWLKSLYSSNNLWLCVETLLNYLFKGAILL